MSDDMSDTVIPKSDQLNADDLIGGKTLTITVTGAKVTKGTEQPVVLNYAGDNGKPYKPGKSMRRVLLELWGKDSQKYIGRSMTLYCDPSVRFGGVDVGGIRISHMSHIEGQRTLALTATRANKKPFVVKPLVVQKQQEETKPDAPPPITPETKKAGEEAAAKGVEAYQSWLGTLAPEVKATVKPFHSEWSKIAKAYVAPMEDDVPFDNDETAADTNEDDDVPGM